MLEPRMISRLKQLGQPANERWEGGVVRLPTWIENGPDGRPFRPDAVIWVSPLRQRAHIELLEPGEDWHQPLLDVFVEFATKPKFANCLASAVHVADAEQARTLRAALTPLPVDVVVRQELPHLNDLLEQMLSDTDHPPLSGMLAAPGVTIDALRAFADAARAFWCARPWSELQTSDIIRIEAPNPEPDLRFAMVLGSEGREFGLGFTGSLEEHEAIEQGRLPGEDLSGRFWLLTFGPAWEMAPEDLDAWERESLPLAADDAYPLLARMEVGGEPYRPDAGQLAWFEGILRAVADASPEELDAGRWTKLVPTSQGPIRFQLALPDLVDESEPADTDAADDAASMFVRFTQERELSAIDDSGGDHVARREALALAFQAQEADGRRQLQLVRRALGLWPDCADAYMILGDRESDKERALAHYQEALRASERALPAEARLEPVPDDVLGADPRTRPYLRARARVADALLAVNRYEEGRDHLRALLRLNPDDIGGVRISLLMVAIGHGDHETGSEVRRLFPQDDSAMFLYGSTLQAWSAGDRAAARSLLRRAVGANRRVPKYLTGRADCPDDHVAFFQPGDESEAIIVAQHFGELWHRVPGAVEWLKQQVNRGVRS